MDKINNRIRDMIDSYQKKQSNKTDYNKELYEILKGNLTPAQLRNLSYRCDNRKYFDFFWHIYTNTQKESCIIKEWKKDLIGRGHKVTYRSNGVDNNGYPILSLDEDISKVDYKVIIDDKEYYLDIKTSPVMKCFTFKINCLKRYIEKNENILLIMTDNGVLKKWQILGSKFMILLNENILGERGYHFGCNKPTQRVWRHQKNSRHNTLGYEELIQNKLFTFFTFGETDEKFENPL